MGDSFTAVTSDRSLLEVLVSKSLSFLFIPHCLSARDLDRCLLWPSCIRSWRINRLGGL